MKCNECFLKHIKKLEQCEDCGKPLDNHKHFVEEKGITGNDNCLHLNCAGCKNGTCNGVHMLVCRCKRCSIMMVG